MKYLIAGLLFFSACSTVQPDSIQGLPIREVSKQTVLKATVATDEKSLDEVDVEKRVKADVLAQEVEATFTVKNHAAKQRIEWAVATIPFPKGKVKKLSQLKQYTTKHGLIDWKIVKWHFDQGNKHSVAIAAARVPVYLQPGQEHTFRIIKAKIENPWPFAFGPRFNEMISQVDPAVMVVAVAKFQGESGLYYAPSLQNAKILHWGDHYKAVRSHSEFKKLGDPSVTKGLNFTSYMSMHNRQDSGEYVFSIGSNTFEKPGPAKVDYVDLYYYTPFKVQVRGAEHYGVSPEHSTAYANYKKIRLMGSEEIGYGTEHTFRGMWSVPTNQPQIVKDTLIAQMESPLIGIASREDWEQSKAGGIVGTVIPMRGATKAQLQAEVQRFCAQDFNVRGSAFYKYANKVPGQTGDQPAFSSNMHHIQQHAIASQSSCTIQHAMHGVQVETYRPSYHWFNKRRMLWTDTSPSCFWWSGIPHYYTNHNNSCPGWKNRTDGYNGFSRGRSYASGEDDQHFGNPILLSFYEMTGDVWAMDILKYRLNIGLWNKMGGNSWHSPGRLGSERSVRLPTDMVSLVQMFPDHDMAKTMKDRLALHMRSRLQGDFNGQFYWGSCGIDCLHGATDIYGIETIVNDHRWPQCIGTTPGGKTHVTQKPYEENRCVITWWTGFSMTFAYQMLRTGIETQYAQDFINKYMNNKDFMFRLDGETYGARRINDWSITRPQLAASWISGWMHATKDYGKNHPNYSYFKDIFFPYQRANAFPPSRTGFLNWEDKWYQ